MSCRPILLKLHFLCLFLFIDVLSYNDPDIEVLTITPNRRMRRHDLCLKGNNATLGLSEAGWKGDESGEGGDVSRRRRARIRGY
ncbi:hypothetical protein RIF29_04558 [Crotalaria pallida]|uniref:Secreted protein n=1 Tax=Crotalaria pallida TaxID=3830 RepID=A0AAN9J1W6_CROPI